MTNNLEIIKEENGNISIVKLPSNLIDAVFPPTTGIKIKNKSGSDDEAELELFSYTGLKYGFKVSSVAATQIKPNAKVPFSGNVTDLVTLLRDSFFLR